MAMDKQTKQLAALGVLVVVAGVVAYFMYFKDDSTTTTADPAPIDKSAMPGTAGGPTPPPTPAGGTPAAAPQVVETDPEMPAVFEWRTPRYEWKWAPPIGRADWVPNPDRGEVAVFDPLAVQNVDVVDPARQAALKRLFEEWRLQGVLEREGLVPRERLEEVMVPKLDENGQPVLEDGKRVMIVDMIDLEEPVLVPDVDVEGNPLYDEDGNPRLTEKLDDNGDPVTQKVKDEEGNVVKVPRMKSVTEYVVGRVLEAWFDGKRQPYRIKDRLPNTRFTIENIFIGAMFKSEDGSDYRVRTGVVLVSDTGARLTIFLSNDERYD